MKRRLSFDAEEVASTRRRHASSGDDDIVHPVRRTSSACESDVVTSSATPSRTQMGSGYKSVPAAPLTLPSDDDRGNINDTNTSNGSGISRGSMTIAVDLALLDDGTEKDVTTFSPSIHDSYHDFSAEPTWPQYSTVPEGLEAAPSSPAGMRKTVLKHLHVAPGYVGPQHRIYIYDLDETLIIFNSLLTGRFELLMAGRKSRGSEGPPSGKEIGTPLTPARVQNIDRIAKLGAKMEKLILEIAQKYFFFADMCKVGEVTHARDVSLYDDNASLQGYDFATDELLGQSTTVELGRRMAYRFRKIRQVYNTPLEELLSPEEHTRVKALVKEIDELSNGWLSQTRDILSYLSRDQKMIPQLVSAGTLTPTYAKCLLYDLREFFPIDNIYSSRNVGKVACFTEIKEYYGSRPRFLAVGDGVEEMHASRQLDIPFYAITSRADISLLHSLLCKQHGPHPVASTAGLTDSSNTSDDIPERCATPDHSHDNTPSEGRVSVQE